MLIVAITVFTLLFGGGFFSLDNVRDAAKEVIEDKDRTKQVVAVTKQAEKEFKSYVKNLNNLSKKLVQMNKDYNLTRKELDTFYSKSDKRRMEFLERFVELRFQAKNQMTAEEWQATYAMIRE
jgi:CMP-N-acetylneuraminic acid synthetase